MRWQKRVKLVLCWKKYHAKNTETVILFFLAPEFWQNIRHECYLSCISRKIDLSRRIIWVMTDRYGLQDIINIWFQFSTITVHYISSNEFSIFSTWHNCCYVWAYWTVVLYKLFKCRVTVRMKYHLVWCRCLITQHQLSKVSKPFQKSIHLMLHLCKLMQ